MNRVTVNLEALNHNIKVIDRWMNMHGATWTLVTKVLCGHRDTLRALHKLGVKSVGDSRLSNLQALEDINDKFEIWYLRLPHFSVIKDVVTLSDVSLNSETEIIESLNAEARRQNKIHRIIVMIELGDLREGILPGGLVKFYNHVFDLSNIEVIGIGANLGCLSGAVPNIDQLTHLALYRELLELKFGRKLPMISAGSSSLLPLLLKGQIPASANHFRIGEAVFLGTDLLNGGKLEGLRDDAITLEAEIAEIKEKSLVPLGETTASTPFEVISEGEAAPGQRGYRALVTIGQLDTEVTGLTPLNPQYQIAGASSDLIVVNLGDNQLDLGIGDSIKFRVDYAALLRLMSGKYIDQVVAPPVEEFISEVEVPKELAMVPISELSDSMELPVSKVKDNNDKAKIDK